MLSVVIKEKIYFHGNDDDDTMTALWFLTPQFLTPKESFPPETLISKGFSTEIYL